MGHNNHGPKWSWAEMTRAGRSDVGMLLGLVSVNLGCFHGTRFSLLFSLVTIPKAIKMELVAHLLTLTTQTSAKKIQEGR